MFKFLLVDSDRDGLLYYGRTLKRKFPNAVLVECTHAAQAIELIKDRELSAAVVHSSADMPADQLIPVLREKRPSLAIVWVSAGQPKKTAAEVGADRFLNYEAWLMVGTVLAEVISERKGLSSPSR